MDPTPVDELRRAAAAAIAAGPPGAHLSVGVVGGPRWDACLGRAQVFDDAGPHPVALTPGHWHDLGSVTKIAGTTAMLAALASAGEVTVDDPVGRYVAGLPSPLAGAPLAELLTHRAGLWEWWPTYVAGGDPIATVAGLPLRYSPGSGRHYSDLGFMLLGRVVERVTGQPIPDAHRRLVADVIGTDGLRYAGPPPGAPVAASSLGDRIEERMIATGKPYPVPVRADGFTRWRRHVLVGEVNDGNAFHSFGGAAGHAGLFGTAAGLHALGAALLASAGGADGGGDGAGAGPWPALGRFLVEGPDAGQLLGFRRWAVSCDGCNAEMIGHTGYPGIGFAFVPRHRATVVLATNRLHVPGEAAAFDPLWQRSLDAAHRALHIAGPAPRAEESP